MATVTTKDGTQIYFKDWGSGQPVVFSHGWPLSVDAWDDQMLILAERGYRCVAHDRRGHGRSSQPWAGNEMDTYADDLATLVQALDLKDAVHIGHSTGGGEVARYIGRHGTTRVATAVLIGAVPPLMLKTAANPGGLPLAVFDDLRAKVLADRSQFFKELATPFYGFNRPGATVSEGLRDSFWLQGMQAGFKGVFDCIKAFSGDRLQRRPRPFQRADIDPARRRRPDRADRCRRPSVGQAGEGRDAEGSPRPPARHVLDPQGRGQRRPVGVPAGMRRR
jgi:non-heme chloroperoxidase